jgi:serine/threonine protein phosphatase PrpC
MITCPECGQEAADGTKFCDRCGQGLAASVTRTPVPELPPLVQGTTLAHGYRIVALVGQTTHENRYRAERAGEAFQLREQPGPAAAIVDDEPEPAEPEPTHVPDPAGPRAKTADLKLRDRVAAANGSAISSAPPQTASTETAPREADDGGVRLEEGAAAEEGSVQSAVDSALVLREELAQRESDKEPTCVEDTEDDGLSDQDLGELFGRVRALSLTLNHPAIQRALDGFAENGRVYLAYRDEQLTPLARRPVKSEHEALNVAIQLCQAVAFVHRRGLRVNDLCPETIALDLNGRVKLTGLDYVSNDDEVPNDPVLDDGYTAPELYRGKRADKRADVFAIGAVLYHCLTGERLEAESWREEAGPIRFYPPHVVTPALENAVRRALHFDPASRWPNVDLFKAELLRLAGVVQIRAAALTDVGKVRELNEDAILTFEYRRESLIEPEHGLLYVVADGMGGAEAGEMASALAVGVIREHVERGLGMAGTTGLANLLQQALEAANRKILEYAGAHPEARGMGSTAVAALIVPADAGIAWVGDSRVYLVEAGSARQLSKDHSLVQRLIEIGQITAEEARHHEHKNVITRSLGARPNGPAGAEAMTIRLKRGDRMILCSDGLTAHVDDAEIGEIVGRYSEPSAAARELIAAALAGGGIDNVSVVVIFVD